MVSSAVYYNSVSKIYDELYGPEQLAKWEVARALISFSKKDKILDVGCGTGLITEKIAEKAGSVIGVDCSEGMIKNARNRKNINYIVADAHKLPFKDKEFDKVLSFTMIQDIIDWNKPLSEMCRVSKGDVIITVQKRGKKDIDIEKKAF